MSLKLGEATKGDRRGRVICSIFLDLFSKGTLQDKSDNFLLVLHCYVDHKRGRSTNYHEAFCVLSSLVSACPDVST